MLSPLSYRNHVICNWFVMQIMWIRVKWKKGKKKKKKSWTEKLRCLPTAFLPFEYLTSTITTRRELYPNDVITLELLLWKFVELPFYLRFELLIWYQAMREAFCMFMLPPSCWLIHQWTEPRFFASNHSYLADVKHELAPWGDETKCSNSTGFIY